MSGWTISSVLFFLPLFAVVLRIHLKAAPRCVPPVAAHGSFGYLIPCSHPLGERAWKSWCQVSSHACLWISKHHQRDCHMLFGSNLGYLTKSRRRKDWNAFRPTIACSLTENRGDGAIFPGNSWAVCGCLGCLKKVGVLLEGGQWGKILSGQPKVRTTNPDLQQWEMEARCSEGQRGVVEEAGGGLQCGCHTDPPMWCASTWGGIPHSPARMGREQAGVGGAAGAPRWPWGAAGEGQVRKKNMPLLYLLKQPVGEIGSKKKYLWIVNSPTVVDCCWLGSRKG